MSSCRESMYTCVKPITENKMHLSVFPSCVLIKLPYLKVYSGKYRHFQLQQWQKQLLVIYERPFSTNFTIRCNTLLLS